MFTHRRHVSAHFCSLTGKRLGCFKSFYSGPEKQRGGFCAENQHAGRGLGGGGKIDPNLGERLPFAKKEIHVNVYQILAEIGASRDPPPMPVGPHARKFREGLPTAGVFENKSAGEKVHNTPGISLRAPRRRRGDKTIFFVS